MLIIIIFVLIISSIILIDILYKKSIHIYFQKHSNSLLDFDNAMYFRIYETYLLPLTQYESRLSKTHPKMNDGRNVISALTY